MYYFMMFYITADISSMKIAHGKTLNIQLLAI